MLGHIGEVPGMEGVAIVHGRVMMNNSANRAILNTGKGAWRETGSARFATTAILIAGLAFTLA